MPTTYCLDTNVLVADPQAIYKFQEHDVSVPLTVLEELDNFKAEMSERGRAARIVARLLDSFREGGSLFDGIPLTRPDNSECGTFRIIQAKPETIQTLPPGLNKTKPDSIILAAVLQVNKDRFPQEENKVVFVTQDVGLRVRCDALGITAEGYKSGRVVEDNGFTGCQHLDVPSDMIDDFYTRKLVNARDAVCFPNEYVVMESHASSALARYQQSTHSFLPLYRNFQGDLKGGDPMLWGISPRNKGQRFALDALLDDDMHLVTLTGKAGSGKTLLALAAGLYLTSDQEHFRRVLAARPIFPMGRDLGYLPGDLDEKLGPWMQPIYDNAELLLNAVDVDGKKKRGHQELIDLGILEIEALTYIRGRSIPRQYMIIDESQNLTPHEIKTIITRAGEDTKIVLTGDPDQIDNPLLDRSNNGLSYVIERFKDQSLAAHITLEKGERSALATLASEIL